MSELVFPTAAVPRAQRIRLPRIVRIELLKLTSTRLSYGLLATVLVLTPAWTSIEASRAGKPNGPAALFTASGQTSIIAGGAWALIFAIVLGVTISSGEFRHQTATNTYLAVPGRNRVLAAKAAAGAIGGAVFGLAAYAVTLVVGLSFTGAHGYRLVIGAGTLADWGIGHMVGAALLGAIGVVVGSLVRSQLAAIIGVFMWTLVVESLIGGLFESARPYLPYTAAAALAGLPLGAANFGPSGGVAGVSALPFAAATALLAAIALAGGLVAARTTVRRDIT
jgi:ABC-2 type transport system permease protein